MKRLLLLLAALLAAPTYAAPAKPPVIRALFVGIDKYLYSGPDNQFRDLRGAVGDVGRIKAALRTAYRLDLDQGAAGNCRSENAVSITLTDTCATRDAILGGLQKQIDASQPGDTLIFYFAGHGSQVADDQVFDQASGRNDTILPTDARKPGAETDGDILDRELRGYVDEATAKGVNVVTIFDSCDSGSGVRGGRNENDEGEGRDAPPLIAKRLDRPAPPIARGPGGGYRVHLAAAEDGSVAREVGTVDNQRAGVFTTALSQTLLRMPNATFGDMMAEVTTVVSSSGRYQIPQIEGAVTATMGGKERSVALFDATPRRGQVTLAAGRLSGMTTGSTIALFASATDALADDAKPTATGTITTVEPTTSTITLDTASPTALPARLIAREVSHAYGDATLSVRVWGRNPKDRAIVAKALAGVPFVRVAEPATTAVSIYTEDKKTLADLSRLDGGRIARLGPITAPDFGATLRAASEKVMRVQSLLALRTPNVTPAPGFCIDNDLDYDQRRCPQSGAGKAFRLAYGAKAKLTVTNTAASPRYLYVYAIGEDNEINLLLPSGGGKDPPLAPNTTVNVVVQPDKYPSYDDTNMWGRYRFVTIASDAPIGSASALEQSATAKRDPASCRSSLERLLCEAASGTRDPSVPRVGAWVATVTDVVISQEKP